MEDFFAFDEERWLIHDYFLLNIQYPDKLDLVAEYLRFNCYDTPFPTRLKDRSDRLEGQKAEWYLFFIVRQVGRSETVLLTYSEGNISKMKGNAEKLLQFIENAGKVTTGGSDSSLLDLQD